MNLNFWPWGERERTQLDTESSAAVNFHFLLWMDLLSSIRDEFEVPRLQLDYGKGSKRFGSMAASSSHVGSSSSSPCAACKFLRRKCTSECVFAPYFPPDQPQKFANVHKIFGASNVTKILSDLPTESRQDAVTSLAFEAEARMRDPVYGCVGAISSAQQRVSLLKTEVEILLERIDKMKLKGIEIPSSVIDSELALPPGSVGLGGGGDQGGHGLDTNPHDT